MDQRTNRNKRKKPRRPWGAPASLSDKVAEMGGRSGFALELDPTNAPPTVSNNSEPRSAGLFGQRTESNALTSSVQRNRQFQSTPRGGGTAASTPCSVGNATTSSRLSRFSRASTSRPSRTTTTAVHVVCTISENLARETCVSSMDAGSPTVMQIAKQGNGNTYAETIAYLEILKPDEVLLNEGRRNSQLARKVMELYNVNTSTMEVPLGENRRQRRRHTHEKDEDEQTETHTEDRYGSLDCSTVVKFISRSYFDQTKGAELLKKISREETYDATVVEEYILLSSAHAVLHYLQHSLGASFAKNSVYLSINAGGNNRMAIDRSTLLQLELLVNSKTGKVRDSLIGTIDCTKTTVGSRLLRTNIMSPPMRVDTVNARLDLVDLFLGDEDFFYTVLEHLSRLPDIDKMLSNIALIPKKPMRPDGGDIVNERMASKGIAALVCIKTTLQSLPALAGVLENHLRSVESREADMAEDATIVTDRSSLLVGLGGGNPVTLIRHHLLRAIIFAMRQPSLTTVLNAVSDIFTESTTAMRNANAMRHQECFAFQCEEDSMMSLLRRAFLSNVDDIYKLADEYAEIYGITVAVRYSAGRGYYLAIPADRAENLPQVFLQPSRSGRFINCTTEAVTSLSSRAADNVRDLLLMTHDKIQEVMGVARANYDAIATLCDSVALLDMVHSFVDHVTLNFSHPWVRPRVTEGSTRTRSRTSANSSVADSSHSSSTAETELLIRQGRFPIQTSELVGMVSGDGTSDLVPNDTYATDDKSFTVITGINGSGKTTYLKTLATITILAHCGCYVPAEQATIPMRDRLCCRLGNADDQEHNISTFMQEMKETAFICNNATSHSLVLVDELGRATSNEDGVAIAWAMSEYLLKKRAMTFFVTHYPQLSCLAGIYPTVQNIHLEASVSKGTENSFGEISYTHRVKSGACTVSTDYGVELAAACGWPSEVVDDARKLESNIKDLLPYESVCHQQQTMDQISDVRTQAFKLLGVIVQDLEGLITDEHAQSFGSIRSDLIQLQQQRIGSVDQEIVAAMDVLLFRESRQQYNERIGRSYEMERDVHDNPEAATPNNSNAQEGENDNSESDGTSDISSSDDDSSLSDSSSDDDSD